MRSELSHKQGGDTDYKKVEEYVKCRYHSDCAKSASFQDPSPVLCIALDLGCDIVCD